MNARARAISSVFSSLREKPKVPSHAEHLKSGAGFKTKNRKKRHRRHQKKLRKLQAKRPKYWKYKEYIKSKEWRERRKQFYAKFGKKCAICGSKRLIGLHHINYKRVGNELDTDLVALCWEHHEKYHDIHGTKQIMDEQTFQFIEEEQQLHEFNQIASNL